MNTRCSGNPWQQLSWVTHGRRCVLAPVDDVDPWRAQVTTETLSEPHQRFVVGSSVVVCACIAVARPIATSLRSLFDRSPDGF